LLSASKAVEENKETARDLAYLRGNGTSLGGLRPKCSILDSDGTLAIGKFPSVKDTRSVVHGEVLALNLATAAGMNAAKARVIDSEGTPVAIITRFDRLDGKRLMYLSARSLLQAGPAQQYTYVDIAAAIRIHSSQAAQDLHEIWRRMVFNILINNVDYHLNNHGFLHHAHGQWKLAPAFDINPFPDKERSLKTWISEESGDVASLSDAVAVANLFGLRADIAAATLEQIKTVIKSWKTQARAIGMNAVDIKSFEPAFMHPEL
jgi:serine/threonine-protein kinase HipA